MIPGSGATTGWRQLPVHLVEIHGAHGVTSSLLTTLCPRRESVLAVEACLGCSRSGGLSVAAGNRTVIECNPGLLVTLPAPHPPSQSSGVPIHGMEIGNLLGGARVSDRMRHDVVCARPDLPLAALARLLVDRALDDLPIVDVLGRPIGHVDARDLVRAGSAPSSDAPARCAADVMQPLVTTIADGVTLAQAAALMAAHHLPHLFVVADDGCLVGLLAALDIVAGLSGPSGHAPRPVAP